MTFANPAMLYLLLPVLAVALIAFFVWSWRRHQALMTEFIQARLLSSLTLGISPARQKFKMACIFLSVVCLILALARPQWGFDWEEVKQKGLDIVIAIDVSKSMLAEDIAPNRLARAKLAALDLMQQARSDRLGLVAFAGAAFLQCPLTIDDSAFRQSVDALDVNTIPEGGTALAEAIETAQAAFKEGDNHRVLVIFTDGEDHDSGAVDAAKKAGEAGMQIFTIGIGSAEGEILRVKDAKGRSDYIRDDQGNVVKSHLNEALLQEIARATPRGFYLRLQGPQAIDTLYREGLAPLPKSESGEKLVRRYHERYHWPLALAMIFLAVEMLVPERKSQRGRRPSERGESGTNGVPARGGRERRRRPIPAEAASRGAAILLLLLPTLAHASSSSALREYNAGRYDQALKEYEKLLQNNKNADPRLHFNAGAAAYQNKSFEEALKQFNAALNSPDLKLLEKGYYNLGNTLYQLGANSTDLEQRKKSWEDALKDFESTMQLNHQDLDAKNNYQFVKKQLEELKQQQQQQNQQQNKDDKQNQEQNQQQQNQNQNQDKDKEQQQKDQQQAKNQQQQKQQDKSSQQQNKDQQDQKNQQAKNEKKNEQQKQDQASADQKKQEKKGDQKEQQQANTAKDKGQAGNKGDEGQTYAAGQMTPQQAQQLLDAQKNEEMLLPVRPDSKPRESRGPIKDW
jgi:Ca-activated chloride channel homolog